jgi:hypothetical protein
MRAIDGFAIPLSRASDRRGEQQLELALLRWFNHKAHQSWWVPSELEAVLCSVFAKGPSDLTKTSPCAGFWLFGACGAERMQQLCIRAAMNSS